MPTYNYDCAVCGQFESVRRIAERDAICHCPACGAAAVRSAVNMPDLQFRSGSKSMGQRSGHGHEGAPRDSDPGRYGGYGGMRHLADCACCPPAKGAGGS